MVDISSVEIQMQMDLNPFLKSCMDFNTFAYFLRVTWPRTPDSSRVI